MSKHYWLRGFRFMALVGLLAIPVPIGAQEGKQQRVLALYVTTPGAAGALAFEATYQRMLADALGPRLDFHSEYIDLARFSDPTYSAALAGFLRFKYEQLQPDVVLATTEASREFAEQYRSLIFPGVPIVFIERTGPSPRQPDTTGVRASLDLAATIDLALTLQPDAAQVFVISGVSAFDRFYGQLAREQLRRFEGRVAVTYWDNLTMADLLRRVARLPPKSVFLFLTFGEDSAGARFVSLDVRDRVASIANAPMYAWNQVAMDHGIVGGRLFTNEIVAARSAELALRILRGERADSIPVAVVDSSLTQVDWRQLQRWNIAESRVPAATAILFRQPTIWDRYKLYISGALALLVLQSALITGLLLQRARRRRAETEMQAHQTMLEASHRQISELFGRLIAAQETERSRIARDLHDDVSQRIAGISIAMSSLKRKLFERLGDSGEIAALSAMQRDTTALADGVRNVSHDLHPSTLQHAGLETALRDFCSEFATLHAISISFSAVPELGSIDRETALCLYRVAQEALHNVVKHARARDVTVTLSRAGGELRLSIIDDGRGFAANGRGHGTGLGLISIDERVRLLGGQMVLDSRPGGGTSLSVSIPQ